MSHVKDADTEFPVQELIASRWSPYGFDPRPVKNEDLCSLFEAARWAPSSFNEQPWSYIVALREQGRAFEGMLSCLMDRNQSWAKNASALCLAVVSLAFSRTGKPNRHALHDLGLASAQLTLEATARGLAVHQMAGIFPEKAREIYQIPEGFEACTALAIGHRAADGPESEFGERDSKPRKRKALREFLFQSKWGKSADFL